MILCGRTAMIERSREWSYSLDGESYVGGFKSRLAAIIDGNREAKRNGLDSFHVGECSFYVPTYDGDHAIRTIKESADEEYGEWAEDWLSSVSDEDRRVLGDMLTGAFHDWLRKTGNVPGMFTVLEPETVGAIGLNA